jgi:hypothetical protein
MTRFVLIVTILNPEAKAAYLTLDRSQCDFLRLAAVQTAKERAPDLTVRAECVPLTAIPSEWWTK